jgi:hypothetical protein
LNNGSSIQFPVGPRKFGVQYRQNNQVININNIGEINMLGKKGLAHVMLESFFPNQVYTFCSCTPETPYSYVNTIKTWKESGRPCRFTVSGISALNFPASIDGFEWWEEGGNGDVYFSLSMAEYIFVGSAVDTTKVSDLSGLKDRTDISTTTKVLQSVKVYPGDSVGDVVGRLIGTTVAMGSSDTTKMSLYSKIIKNGGLSTGDIIAYNKEQDVLKVNGTNV